MLNNLIEKLKIEKLKYQLIGKATKMSSDKSGYKLEEVFRNLIIKPENGGENLKSLEENKILFNENNSQRQFHCSMIGFIEFSQLNNLAKSLDLMLNNFENQENSLNQKNIDELQKYLKLVNYEVCEQNKDSTEIKYNNMSFNYDIKNKKIEGNNINTIFDIIDDIKFFGKKSKKSTDDKSELNSLKSYNTKDSENIFIKIYKLIKEPNFNNEKKFKKKELINLTKEDLINYVGKINLFAIFMKKKFNKFQNGWPIILKFAKLNINQNMEKEEKEVFIFHIIFKRELDSAFMVLKDGYDFIQFSGLKEIKISKEKEEKLIFNKNDICLIELKDIDKRYDKELINCILYNYDILNLYVKYLKTKNEFKNCNFFYVGIQNKINENNSDIVDILNKIENKSKDNLLKVKLFYFENDEIFNIKFREFVPENSPITRNEFEKIKKKLKELDNLKQDIKYMKTMMTILIIFVSFIILFK